MELDAIEITGLRVECVIGVLEREQTAPQPIEIDLRLRLDLGRSGDRDALQRTVDYADVVEQVSALAVEGRFRLIESLGVAIARMLLAPPAQAEERALVEEVEVAIRKPSVLGGVAVPGVRIKRPGTWCDLSPRALAPGLDLEVLFESPRCGAYRLHVGAAQKFDVPEGAAIHVVAGVVDVDGRSVKGGAGFARGVAHQVTNLALRPACLLVLATPRLP